MKADESSAADARAQPGTFTTIHWSVVLRVGQEDSTQAMLALEQRYREAIREEIAQTVTTALEIEEELRHLVSVLSS